MLTRTSRIIGFATLLVMLTSMLLPTVSLASTTGRRNTAIGLTAGAIYSAVRGKKTAAIALGAGAAYAWKRHSDARKNQAYRRGYYAGRRHAYQTAYYHRHHHHRR